MFHICIFCRNTCFCQIYHEKQENDCTKNTIFINGQLLFIFNLRILNYRMIIFPFFPRYLMIIAVFYTLPVVQLVFTYQRVCMNVIHCLSRLWLFSKVIVKCSHIIFIKYISLYLGFKCKWWSRYLLLQFLLQSTSWCAIVRPTIYCQLLFCQKKF